MIRTMLQRGAILARQSRPPLNRPIYMRQFAARPQDESKDGATMDEQTPADAPPSDLEKLTTELAEKDTKIAELNDRTLRVLAEMENVRAIARRDVDNAKKYGIVNFAKGLLDVADNLALALKSVPEDKAAAADSDPHLVGLYSGVKATESELLKVFSKHGLARYGKVGDTFDPLIHQAMYEAPADSVDPGIILDVTKSGYSIGERVLRPAEVGVSKATS